MHAWRHSLGSPFSEFGPHRLTMCPAHQIFKNQAVNRTKGRATEVSANKRKPLYLHLTHFCGTPAQFLKILHPLISRCSYRRLVFAVKRQSTTSPF